LQLRSLTPSPQLSLEPGTTLAWAVAALPQPPPPPGASKRAFDTLFGGVAHCYRAWHVLSSAAGALSSLRGALAIAGRCVVGCCAPLPR
jgi:hypothetical protein